MKRINHKSVLDCYEETEREEHSYQIDQIFDAIYSMEDYDCIYTIEHMDELHEKHREAFTVYDKLSKLDEVIESCDFKNGIDAYINDEGNLAFLVYGQGYKHGGKHHLVETLVTIKAKDNHNNLINMTNEFLGDIRQDNNEQITFELE